MKKNTLAVLTSASLLLSPLFLTGCQSMGDVFGDGSNHAHQGYQSYGAYGHPVKATHQRGNAMGTAGDSSGTAANATKVRTYQPKNASSAVPLEAPTVHNASSSNDDSSNAASSSPNAVPGSSASYPASPTVVPASAPAMAAPSVGE